jgi:hypothetical protein
MGGLLGVVQSSGVELSNLVNTAKFIFKYQVFHSGESRFLSGLTKQHH